MNQSRRYFSFLALPFLIFLAFSAASAQTDPVQQAEPTYELSLQVVIGSNEPGPGTNLPQNLSGISRQLKNNFSFSNYRLATTFLGRISNNGNLEYKSISNILGQESDSDAQTFLDWSIVNLRSMARGFQARTFRFGARVPVQTGTGLGDKAVINYENVGLNMTTLGLPANTPTLLGTVSLPKTSGTIFLVATIRSADL